MTWLRTFTVGISIILSGCGDSQPDQNTVRVVSWGGQFQEDLLTEWVRPAAAEANLNLEADTWDGNYGALTTRIERGRNNWDVVHVEAHYVMTPAFSRLFHSYPSRRLETLSPEITNDAVLRDLIREGRAAPVLEYAYVVAGRSDRLGGQRASAMTWRDFWDTARLPGRRGLRDFPIGNIEAALASMGRNPETDLYAAVGDQVRVRQIVSEALDRLNEIRPQIDWWTTGDELQQQLETGDDAMVGAWSGRVRAAFRTLCPGNSNVNNCVVGANPATALISTDWWIIPNGAAHAENGNRLLTALFSSRQVQGASRFADKQGYSAPVVGAEPTDPVAQYFLHLGSSANNRRLARINERFWGVHFDEVNRMWRDWRARNQ